VQFAFNVPNFGPYSDPRLTADLAHQAEESGWDGFFVWDHMQWPFFGPTGKPGPTADPWVIMTLIADRTNRIKFGPIVTPLPRRQPWKVARETVTLDQLSDGRLIVGVGLGGGGAEFETAEFANFGLSTDLKVRAEMLDEELAIISGLWSGEEVNFAGKHYQVKDTIFQPPSLQQPRIPVWVAGMWPLKNPARRAARWDGYAPLKKDLGEITPADVRDMVAFFRQERSNDAPFDIIIGGGTPGDSATKASDIVRPFADAGATWWNEGMLPWESDANDVRRRLRQGPPRL
jgi:alkanesulfonate monooxygenase SsuD/methylene tetrahydromethanopterin reductase-like flavin-dependent oxidoreductase (luciferase family)